MNIYYVYEFIVVPSALPAHHNIISCAAVAGVTTNINFVQITCILQTPSEILAAQTRPIIII